jgi:mRNA interferase RelE/StbE
MYYTVHIRHAAEKDLSTLATHDRTRIDQTLENLATTPRPPGVQKLSKPKDYWRIRTGNHRVIYQINDRLRIVQVARISHRKQAYRAF